MGGRISDPDHDGTLITLFISSSEFLGSAATLWLLRSDHHRSLLNSRSPRPMTDFRLRRTAAVKSSKANTATHVAQVVGTNLKEIRRVQGHSLDTLAAASGVSRAMLGQIETGKSVPTITLLWKVAAALGVQVAQLITDPDVPHFTVTRRADREKAAVERSGSLHSRNELRTQDTPLMRSALHRDIAKPTRPDAIARPSVSWWPPE